MLPQQQQPVLNTSASDPFRLRLGVLDRPQLRVSGRFARSTFDSRGFSGRASAVDYARSELSRRCSASEAA
eukprot:s2962_g7.t1